MTEEKHRKFDVIIGNPPFQDESIGNNSKAPSIYHLFMESSYKIGDVVELIHPARFLFNAGDTPKKWNRKMLNSNHIKVTYFTQNSATVFPTTDIKGGIAITYFDKQQNFPPIKTFSIYPEVNTILHKVLNKNFESLSEIVYSPVAYKFTQKMHDDYPDLKSKLSKGNEFEVKTNVFDTIPEVFFDKKPDDNHEYMKILGRLNSQIRCKKYIRKDYISNNTNLDYYKVALAESNGKGTLGETLAEPQVLLPGEGHTQTFLTIGCFKNEFEAIATRKYISSKFARTLLGTLKITQHNSISTWKNVPMQDFTDKSDIDWTKSIPEIDQQLYKKYNLSDDEIAFIEKNVKEMK